MWVMKHKVVTYLRNGRQNTDKTDAADDVVARRTRQRLALQRKTPFKLKPHHAKPIRKRHLVSFSLFVLTTVISAAAGLGYLYGQFNRQMNASLSVKEQASGVSSNAKVTTISSSLGFGLSFDAKLVSVQAAVQQSAGAPTYYDSYNIGQRRAYSSVTFTALGTNGLNAYGSSMVVMALTDKTLNSTDDAAKRALAQQFGRSTSSSFAASLVGESSLVATNGLTFFKQTYRYQPTSSSPRGELVFSQYVSDVYVGALANGVPVVVKINAPDEQSSLAGLYVQILKTFSLDTPPLSANTNTQRAQLAVPAALSLAQKLGLATTSAHAATPHQLDESQIIAQNAPSVVKIYHIVCGDISYRGKVLTTNSCSGTSGSGFFVSSDGYLITNGHVVSSNPKDVIINNMSASLIARMMSIDGYSATDVATIVGQFGTGNGVESMAAQAVGKLPDDALVYGSQKDFYIVALSSDVPKISQIVSDHSFKETATIKLATLKGIDYSTDDLYSDKGFTHSDVAVLKLSGDNYPVVHLGSMGGLVQGDGLTVIGFPGDAESNLVRNDILQSTATQGIVGAIREVNGGDLKVVQSDVNIGHGNSGGPAFDRYGKVIGVATYLIGGAQNGDAGISYLRDINDARNLLSAQGVTLDTASRTQAAWEAGLKDFYAAHYKSAITKFNEVKSLYPSHVLASQYITIAQANIANGEEAQSVWVPVSIVIALVASLGGVVAVVIVMVRHRAHYHLYQAIQAGYIHGPFAGMQHAARTAELHHGH
jgi:S1-C subfamily serine protease